MSRKLDFSKFHTSDDEEDGLALPKSKLDLSETKAKIFSQGDLRKSKKDLEREAEERKAKEEAEASAKALEEFTAAFEGDGVENQPLGGMMGGFRRGRGGGFVRAGGDPSGSGSQYHMGNAYAPPRAPAAMMPKAMRPPPPAAFAPPSPPRGAPKPKGKRAMDAFLEEIKKDQEIRDKKFGHAAKMEGSSVSSLAAMQGVKNTPEAASTNLFISNLPGIVTEESLGLFFAQHGPVGTVKIMWPRGDFETMAARRAKPSLTGFVAFMKRDDAEKALNATDGQDFAGTLLRVSWGKPAPIPLRPIYDLNLGQSRGRSRSRSPKPHRRDEKRDRSRSRSDSRSRSPARKRHRSRTRSPSRSRSPERGRDSRRRGRSRSRSFSVSSRSRSPQPNKKPASEKERYLATVSDSSADFIKAVASKVKQFGPEFERMLLEKEKANSKFAFLRDEKIPEYHIYKLAVDGRHRVTTPPPFDFEDEGYASVYSSDSAEESERERTAKGKLGKIARKRFEACLRGMSGIRAEIARAMEFAMHKADAADDIAEIVCQSLRVEDTPVPRKMARLYLISDILHNSASPLPNVWKYRLAFETRLPPVFTHFCAVHRSLNAYSGKIAADVFKQQVLGMVEIWENWIVFTPGMTDKLRLFFDGATEASLAPAPATKPVEPEVTPSTEPAPSRFKKGGFKAAFVPVATPAAPPPVDTIPEPDVDLDGEAMDDDLDGEAMDDLDGEDMDGEDMDGEAMEDVDGEAM